MIRNGGGKLWSWRCSNHKNALMRGINLWPFAIQTNVVVRGARRRCSDLHESGSRRFFSAATASKRILPVAAAACLSYWIAAATTITSRSTALVLRTIPTLAGIRVGVAATAYIPPYVSRTNRHQQQQRNLSFCSAVPATNHHHLPQQHQHNRIIKGREHCGKLFYQNDQANRNYTTATTSSATIIGLSQVKTHEQQPAQDQRAKPTRRNLAIPKMTPKTPSFLWACLAYSDPSHDNDTIHVETINTSQSGTEGQNDSAMWLKSVAKVRSDVGLEEVDADSEGKFLDLTVSTDWFEFVESDEEREHDEGGAGAYDTLRCDMLLHDNTKWNVWGLDYHLNRLQESYRSLLKHTETQNGPKTTLQDNAVEDASSSGDRVERAIQQAAAKSRSMLRIILEKASLSLVDLLPTTTNAPNKEGHEDLYVVPLRFTWLWSMDQRDPQKIIVRAHACSSAMPIRIHEPAQPIVVSVAAVLQSQQPQGDSHPGAASNSAVMIDESLPRRHDRGNPNHKLASWTRRRKQMELPDKYKPAGVSEVLMVRPANNNKKMELEVLEGLSSNFFVIYKDNTVRTAQTGVLCGYVRHLILESCEACGLKVDTTNPCLLSDAQRGLWKECFITSSSRLIYPISRILLAHQEQEHQQQNKDQAVVDGIPQHFNNGRDFVEYWQDPVLTAATATTITNTLHSSEDTPKWQLLLDEILRRGGYPPRLSR